MHVLSIIYNIFPTVPGPHPSSVYESAFCESLFHKFSQTVICIALSENRVIVGFEGRTWRGDTQVPFKSTVPEVSS